MGAFLTLEGCSSIMDMQCSSVAQQAERPAVNRLVWEVQVLPEEPVAVEPLA